jgi:hypothetical protein
VRLARHVTPLAGAIFIFGRGNRARRLHWGSRAGHREFFLKKKIQITPLKFNICLDYLINLYWFNLLSLTISVGLVYLLT